MDRLHQFLTVDSQSRDRAALISMAAGFLFGLVSKLFGYAFEVSAYGTAMIVFLAYSLQTWLYCRTPAQVTATHTQQLIARRWYLIATGITVVLLAILPERSIDAAIIDRRLRKTSQGPILSPAAAREVTETLDTAREKRIVVAPTIITQVRDTVRTAALKEPMPPFTDAASALVNYVRSLQPLQAELEMRMAVQEMLRATHFNSRKEALLPVDQTAAKSAIALASRVIEHSGSNVALRNAALFLRARLYELLSMYDEALADVEAADELGAADLSDAISVEGVALVNRGLDRRNSEDLKRGIELLTLETHCEFPASVREG